ncbi:MAG TPA: DNA alkylation repair protein [Chloroflexota bacterium]|nr:DNA alkylation repair protein [Chloroflexota bacterium]
MVRSELVVAIRTGLAERADPVRAPGMQAYMKSSLPYRGVSSPIQTQLYREVFPRYPITRFDDWQETLLALWNEANFREERYAALALIGYRGSRTFRTLDALPLFVELIVTGAWWDLVDGLATHEIGDLLRGCPAEMRPTLLRWSRGPDPWLRRTAIICQVGFKGATDQNLLFACIAPNLAERGFFLRKAIGWALREYAKAAPDAVGPYVAEHESELSALCKREALKHMIVPS